MQEHHLPIRRTARFHTLGEATTAREAWFVLHGYGQLARYFLRHFSGLEKERLIVAPEAPARFYLDPEHNRVGASWMTREDREHEILDQVVHGDALVDHVRQLCGRELPLAILGFSQGVATACRWSIRGHNRFVRVVLWGGSMPPAPELEGMRQALAGTTVDVVHGMQDDLVPREQADRTAARLRDAGVRYTLHQHEGGHELDALLLRQLIDR